MKALAVFFLAAVLSVLQAENFNTKTDWRKGTFDGKTLRVNRKETSPKLLKVDPSKACRLTFEYRMLPDGKPGKIRAAFRLFDLKKREIRPYHVIIRTPSIASVAETVPAGSRTIRLNGCGRWKRQSHFALAFQAKPDLSDLPNFNTFESFTADFKKRGKHLHHHLQKTVPLRNTRRHARPRTPLRRGILSVGRHDLRPMAESRSRT